jgi:hypothetical protein
MSRNLNWDRDRTRQQTWDALRRRSERPIESTVPDQPATERQADSIRRLCDETGAAMPDTSQMTTRGAHWTIQNLKTRAGQR